MVLPVRIELTTSPLPRGCSTTELRQRRARAISDDGMRPRDGAFLATRPQVAQARPPCQVERTRPSARQPISVSLPAMNERPKAVQKARRERRLGTALRDNLKRRKAQARSRSAADGGERARPPHESAGIVDEKQSR